jgi:hypothetical protein
VQGTVDSTEVVRESGEDGPQYVPVVSYRYGHEGETCSNDEYSLVDGPTGETPDQARETLEPYSVGGSVTVHVVPSSPSESYLERGSTGLFMYGIVGFLVFVGGSSVFALVAGPPRCRSRRYQVTVRQSAAVGGRSQNDTSVKLSTR